MKRRFLIAICLLFVICARAQDVSQLIKKYSVAISAGELGYDTGLGIEFGTPSFFHRLNIRPKANKTWLESNKTARDHWATYNLIGVSMVYRIATIERSLIYTEIGGHVIFPSIKFSEINHIPGINGLLGVDLFITHTPDVALSYFICGGVGYTSARAEKLEGNPRYANGFLFSNGLRFYF